MHLYGPEQSPFVVRVRIACRFKGLSPTDTAIPAGDQRIADKEVARRRQGLGWLSGYVGDLVAECPTLARYREKVMANAPVRIEVEGAPHLVCKTIGI